MWDILARGSYTKTSFMQFVQNFFFEVIDQSQLPFQLYQSFQTESYKFRSDREIDTVFFNMTSILTLQQLARYDQTPFIDTCLYPPPFTTLQQLLFAT